MLRFNILKKSVFVLLLTVAATSCNEQLTELNENPNGVDPATANPNMTIPNIQVNVALQYQGQNYGDLGGVAQYIQHDGWFGGINHYDWSPNNWTGWYDILRNNKFLYSRAVALDYKLHQGIALTMKAFIFGTVTDLWGDAPYTNALKGDESDEFLTPDFDSQEMIYKGVIEDLKAASALFATGDKTGYLNGYDVYFNGDPAKWQKFANSLLLRYSMRISSKLPELAKSGIESVYSSGIYMKSSADDAAMAYLGTTSGNSWPTASQFDTDEGTNFRRKKPAQLFVQTLVKNKDPRLQLWINPVNVRWVADPTLTTAVDPFIRKNGVIQNGVLSMTELQLNAAIKAGDKFTRHYNPSLYNGELDTGVYVGVPAGLRQPDYYNNNPTPGQSVQNQHVSQLTDMFRASSGGLLKARLATAAESHFILAEAATKGWSVGSAETHYNEGIKSSLQTWGLSDKYDAFIAQPEVKFNNTLAQLMEQKWIANFTVSSEAWFDYRRTGLPAFKAGPASPENVLPVRFIYGDNEVNVNSANADEAISRLEANNHTTLRGKNSQWAKPWLLQGTGKPW